MDTWKQEAFIANSNDAQDVQEGKRMECSVQLRSGRRTPYVNIVNVLVVHLTVLKNNVIQNTLVKSIEETIKLLNGLCLRLIG